MNADGKVLVWLDPSASQESHLEVLAGFEADTEVLGLFVEDTNLLTLSSLSVAREVTFESPTARAIEPRAMERSLRVHRARMQSLFETAAKQIKARCSFRTIRGELVRELLSCSSDFDTLVIAHSRGQIGPRLRLRSQLDELLSAGPSTLVFVQERWRTGRGVAVLFDGGKRSGQALRIAEAFARAEGQQLSIWLPPEGETDRKELESIAGGMLASATDHVFRSLADYSMEELANFAQVEELRVLVLPEIHPESTKDQVAELLDRINCSLIITR